MFYLNCICVALIFVLISDIFHFWDNFSPIITKWLTKGKVEKPIPSKIMTCSLCQSHWVNLIMMFIMGVPSIPNYLFILVCAWLTTIMPGLIFLIENTITKIISKINHYVDVDQNSL